MNNCLTVQVTQGPGNRAAPSAQSHTGLRLAFWRTAQNISRLSLGVFFSGLSGTTESTPLIWMGFRLFGAVVQLFRALPKRSAMDRLFLHRLDGHSQGQAGARNFGSAVAIAEPSRDRHDRSFLDMWVQSESGARFERKRLIRMSHQLPSGHKP